MSAVDGKFVIGKLKADYGELFIHYWKHKYFLRMVTSFRTCKIHFMVAEMCIYREVTWTLKTPSAKRSA